MDREAQIKAMEHFAEQAEAQAERVMAVPAIREHIIKRGEENFTNGYKQTSSQVRFG